MSAIVDALLHELDDVALRRLAERLAPYLEATGQAAPELLTPTEAAVLLRCARKRVYELAQRGALPVHRDGGRLLIRRTDLHAYIDRKAA